MKKGDLSINIIIVAAIALIILVIISVLVFRSGSQVSKGTSCEGVGGQCTLDQTCAEYGEQMGETYLSYQKRTKRILPGIY